ncbi:efflux RND transporter periplasmic adaptor subunit, partial [Ideonella livida]
MSQLPAAPAPLPTPPAAQPAGAFSPDPTVAAAPAPAAGTPPRRRWLRTALGAAAVAAVGGAGWAAWRGWAGRQDPAETPLLLAVQRGDIEDLVAATGTLQPRNYVDVGAQVSGQLRRLAVEVGDEVREGDLLAEIDAEQTAARVDSYRAQIRNQQAQLAEADIGQAKAERDLRRQRQLLADEATTPETLQNAETTLAAARASRESILAQIAQIQATMRVEEANLKYTRLLAPLSGTVVSISARQGQTLNTNQSAPTVLRVADLSLMTVQAQVSEADVARLRLGMPVYFTTLGSPGRRWPGRLQKIEPTPTVTNNVVLYNALFEVPNPQRQLMTQMTAQVFFVVAQVQDVLVVPMAAVTLVRGSRKGEGGAVAAPPASAATTTTGTAIAASASTRAAPPAPRPAASRPVGGPDGGG